LNLSSYPNYDPKNIKQEFVHQIFYLDLSLIFNEAIKVLAITFTPKEYKEEEKIPLRKELLFCSYLFKKFICKGDEKHDYISSY